MKHRARRGFTIAEVLTVLVIVGLMLGAVAFAMPLIMGGPIEAQSQVDGVQSSALALYRVQHDVRQSNVYGIFDCSMPPAPVCSIVAPPAPGSTPPATPALVVVTADNPNGIFAVAGAGSGNTGYPKWQGFYVYWLTPNADGTSQSLHRVFSQDLSITETLGIPNVSVADAQAVLTAAIAGGGGETVAQAISGLHVAIDQVNNIAHLQLDGGDTSGNKSSLDLTSNSYVRN